MSTSDVQVKDVQFYVRAALFAYKTADELVELERLYRTDKENCILKHFYDRLVPGFVPVRIETKEGLEFSYVELEDEIVFMMPGTRKRPDALIDDFNTDFNMDLISTDLFGPKVQVHRGFFERYKIIRHEILKVVNKMGNKKRYCSVGHSLGAAMSIFTSLELKIKNMDARVFVFAPPKIGPDNFNKLVRQNLKNIIRVVRMNDFLPKLSPIPPYEHFGGNEITIDSRNSTWLWLGLISLLTLLFSKNYFISFFIAFLMTLIGAQLTHSTESYVEFVDLLKKIEFSEPSNYPTLSDPFIAAQWVPICVLVVFAYSRLYSLQAINYVQKKYRKTLLARLLKRLIKRTGNSS